MEPSSSWEDVREIVLERDGHRCVECGFPALPGEPLHAHHLIPRSEGGPDLAANLITLCAVHHALRHPNLRVGLARRAIERAAVWIARSLDPERVPESATRLGIALRILGASRFRDGQLDIVLAALRGESILAVRPTGSGKSLCFQLPVLLAATEGYVVSPLKALMSDQVTSLAKKNVPAAFLNSSQSPREQRSVVELLANDALRFLYCAPERFNPGAVWDKRLTAAITARRPSYLVVDEAHCVDLWGEGFRPEYAELARVREQLGRPPVLAFTATAGPALQRRVLASLGVPDARVFLDGVDRPNIRYARSSVEKAEERAKLVADLHLRLGGRCMVFVPTVAMTTRVSDSLAKLGMAPLIYHGKMRPKEQAVVLGRFDGSLEPTARIVVCTSAFGMGIDIPDVRLVVNWGQPPTVEDYVQQVGRAGRDGDPALALLFHSPDDKNLHMFLAGCLAGERRNDPKRPWTEAQARAYLDLASRRCDEVASIARTSGCVRAAVMRYFGVESDPSRPWAMRVLDVIFAERRWGPRRRRRLCCDGCDPGLLSEELGPPVNDVALYKSLVAQAVGSHR